ncbi:MAG: hypothetical protein FWG02_11150 [Holophagaceae bacterium]|nr:hypothetical protein [Holophagaceae bacterium]
MLLAFFCVYLFCPQQPQERPKVFEAEIVTKSKQITIPHVPSSTSQANKEQRRVNALLRNSLLEVEQELTELYKNMPPKDFFRPLKFPWEIAEIYEIQFMGSILEDQKINTLTDEIIRLWNSWQMTIVETGSAKIADDYSNAPMQSQKVAPSIVSLDIANRMGGIHNEGGSITRGRTGQDMFLRHNLLVEEVLDFWDNMQTSVVETWIPKQERGENVPSKARDADSVAISTDAARRDYSKSRELHQLAGNLKKIAVISNEFVPNFSKAWDLYSEYLNERTDSFAEVVGSDIVHIDSDVRHLYNIASIVFFEQIRLSLWICQNVWNRMAARASPPPLKKLSPYFIELPNLGVTGEYHIVLKEIDNPGRKGSYGVRPVLFREATPVYIPGEDELLEPVTATLVVNIDMEGNVTEVDYISGQSYLREISMYAAKLLKFMPLRRTGFKSAQSLTVSFTF